MFRNGQNRYERRGDVLIISFYNGLSTAGDPPLSCIKNESYIKFVLITFENIYDLRDKKQKMPLNYNTGINAKMII